LLSTSGLISVSITQFAGEASRWLLVIAIAAAGIKTSFEDLIKLGWQPVLMLVTETVFIAGFIFICIFANLL
jgi:uncharacterized membrane protein YadS